MRIAVIGTGPVGQALARKLAAVGHEVVVGTRDPEATLARSEPDMLGNPPFKVFHEEHPTIGLAPLAEAAADAELVVNATNGAGSIEALEGAGEDNLAGKVLVDIANPLDFSQGMPPSLFGSSTDSLGERIQRRFREARVVKALNTVNALLMVDPGSLAGGDHSIFVAGNDADAKATVTGLLESFGWTDVIDLGDITSSRGPEMYVVLWTRLWMAVGTPAFSIKVVR
jgi:8-hydroxy-5-deazaflavin:NADPH oxidoreductase